MYDVAIVGAGPAGAYTGYLAAREGLNVVILDKERFPRDKVCGGGISNKTIELLDFDITPVVQRRIVGAYLTYQNRETVVKDLGDRAGLTTLRRDFDHYLLDRALEQGITFKPGAAFLSAERGNDHIEVSTSSGTYRARYLLGADGVFSAVRKAFFEEDLVSYAPAVEVLVPVGSAVIERLQDRVLFDLGGMTRGYGWIFPKRHHLNVGVFSVFPSRGLRDELKAFLGRYSLSEASRNGKRLGFCIPLRNTHGRFQDGNVWLLGDAAGFAESFFGEGIYFALKSAVVAASTLVEAFDDPEAGLYSRRVREELVSDLRYSELNARLFFRFARFGFERMARSVHVSDTFAGLITGHVGHRECFFKTMVTAPYWMFSEKLEPREPLDLGEPGLLVPGAHTA